MASIALPMTHRRAVCPSSVPNGLTCHATKSTHRGHCKPNSRNPHVKSSVHARLAVSHNNISPSHFSGLVSCLLEG